MKKSLIFLILTIALVCLTLAGLVFFVLGLRDGGEPSPLLVMGPCVAALLCSNLYRRAKNEKK